MAKGDVTLKFDAETAAYLQKIRSATDAYAEQTNKTRALGDAHEKAGHQAEKFGEKVADVGLELIKMAAIPTSIMGGFELLMKNVEMTIERLEKRFDAVSQRASAFDSYIYGRGAQGNKAPIEARLGDLAGQKYGQNSFAPSTVERLYGTIGSASGPHASFEPVMAAVEKSLHAMGSGASEQQAVELGAGIVNLMAMSPGMGADEAAELSHESLVNAPGILTDAANLRVIARGSDKKETLRRMEAAARTDVGVRALHTMEKEMLAHGRTLDDAFANPQLLKPEFRPQMLAIKEARANLPEVISPEVAESQTIAQRTASGVLGVVKSNLAQDKLRRLGKDPSPELIRQVKREMAADIFENEHQKDYGVLARTISEGAIKLGYGESASFGTSDEQQAQSEAQAEMVELLREISRNTSPSATNPHLQSDKEGQK